MRRRNLWKILLGTGLYLLDPVRDRLADRMEDLSGRVQDTYEGAADRVESLTRRIRGEGHTASNILYLLLGVGVGVGVGMLFAPASGQETRSNLSEKVQDFGGKVRERFSSEPKPASGTYGE